MNKSLIIICGLPRSGTTYVHSIFFEKIINSLVVPEETHLLIDKELISQYIEFHCNYFDKYLLQDRQNGYSPYGVKDVYLENAFISFCISHSAINLRQMFGDTIDYPLNAHYALLQDCFHKIYHANSIVLKKPTAELYYSQHASLIKERRLLYVYCYRDVINTFESVVRGLGWFDLDHFVSTAIDSYNAFLSLFDKGIVVPYCIDNVGMGENKRLLKKIYSATGAEFVNYNEFQFSSVNSANHLKSTNSSNYYRVEDLQMHRDYDYLLQVQERVVRIIGEHYLS